MSGIQSALASGMATPSMNSTLSDSPSKSPSKSKTEIERSKLIRYAKELRKRVSERDGKIETLNSQISENTEKIESLNNDKVKIEELMVEQRGNFETEIKSL